MRKKTIEKIKNELKNQLKLTDEENEILTTFIIKKSITPKRPLNYYQIKLFADRNNLNFDYINNLYMQYMEYKAKELNKNIIHGLIIKPNENNGKLYLNQVNLIADIESYYFLLKCNQIDIQERKINNKTFDFIFDDEMLLKEPKFNQICAIERNQREYLYKKLLIVGKADRNGKETTLNEEDLKIILENVMNFNIGTKEKPKPKTILIYNY